MAASRSATRQAVLGLLREAQPPLGIHRGSMLATPNMGSGAADRVGGEMIERKFALVLRSYHVLYPEGYLLWWLLLRSGR